MNLSGHTTCSTLPRLVFQGHGFEASFLIWARLDFSHQKIYFLTEAMIFNAQNNNITSSYFKDNLHDTLYSKGYYLVLYNIMQIRDYLLHYIIMQSRGRVPRAAKASG